MAKMEPMSDERRLTNQAEAAARVVQAFRQALGDNWSGAETPDHIAESFATKLITGRFSGGLLTSTERQPIDPTCKDAGRIEIPPSDDYEFTGPFTFGAAKRICRYWGCGE